MKEQLLAFLSYLEQEYQYSGNTIAAYKNDLSQFLRFLTQQKGFSNASAHWHNITQQDVDAYVAFMKEKAYASSSVARKVAAVKSFFNFLYARGIISENPTTKIESPKVKKRLPKALSSEEVERLLAAPMTKKTPKHLRDTALLHTLYATGMRVTEVVSLQLADVDLKNETLTCPGKDGETRILPFDDKTKTILSEYLENGRPYLVKDANEQALFLNHRGQQLTRQGLWLIIKAYARQVNLSIDVTPHTLRHSFAAHKLESGTGIQEVQRLLGHANISTTQIYTQLTEEEEVGAG